MNEAITITKCVYGGDGMGRLADGRAVFVPFTLPGEEVLVEIVEDTRNFARGRVLQLLTPSSRRVPAPCPHFGECGGCHYQHASYPTQLALKLEILADQLARLGGFSSPPISGITPSPKIGTTAITSVPLNAPASPFTWTYPERRSCQFPNAGCPCRNWSCSGRSWT